MLSTFSNGALIDGKYRIEVLQGAVSMGTVFMPSDEIRRQLSTLQGDTAHATRAAC